MSRVSLKVRSLHWVGANHDDLEFTGRIPSNLKYGNELLRTEDIDMDDAKAGGSPLSSTPLPTTAPIPAKFPFIVGLKPPGLQSQQDTLRTDIRGGPLSDTERAQVEKDKHTKELLRRMLPVRFLCYNPKIAIEIMNPVRTFHTKQQSCPNTADKPGQHRLLSAAKYPTVALQRGDWAGIFASDPDGT